MDVYASAFKTVRPGVAIIGAGSMGRALALRLAESGFPVRGVISRTLSDAEALASLVGAPVASDRQADIPSDAQLVFLTVPDDQIADLAETLTAAPRSWQGTAVAHLSGALPAAVLDPLVSEGAIGLAFHPLQTVTRDASADTLANVYAGLEGDARAVATGIEIAVALGMRYVVLSADAKPRYHAAAAMASNLVVTLIGMAEEVLSSLGVDRAEATAMLAPMLRSTVENAISTSPEDALTGPVARGDLATLRQHGLALRKDLPDLVPAYAAMSVEAVRLAVRAGKLDPERAESVLALLERMVTVPLPKARPAASEQTPSSAETGIAADDQARPVSWPDQHTASDGDGAAAPRRAPHWPT